MLEQSFDYTFPFIDTPDKPVQQEIDTAVLSGLFTTSTGSLDFTQLEALFDVLPIDLTLIDENNKVRYFTRPKERIFLAITQYYRPMMSKIAIRPTAWRSC